jgi:CrcB protein
MNVVYVFIGGGLGSVVRYGISYFFTKWALDSFPFATFISNIIACLLLGTVTYYLAQKQLALTWIQPLIIIGFCGGFSTFSTFSNETLQLLNNGNFLIAAINIVFSIAIGIASIYLTQKGS